MLERQHQPPALVVVDQRRARPAKARRPRAGRRRTARRRRDRSAKGMPQRAQCGAAMKAKAGQQAAQSAPGSATISLQPRQSGGRTASSSVARPSQQQSRRRSSAIEQGKCVGKRAIPYPPPRFRPTYSAVTTRSPAGLRPRRLAPAPRARGPPLGRPGLPEARDRRRAWSSGWTTCAAAFALALDLGCHGDEVADGAGRPRRPSDCWCAPTSASASRATRAGPAVVADEEALPFAPRSLRSGAERDGPALGQRPAGHPDPDRAHPEARRAVPRRHAGRRHACGSCARRWPRPRARSRAA